MISTPPVAHHDFVLLCPDRNCIQGWDWQPSGKRNNTIIEERVTPVVEIDSSPPIRFYKKFESASKTLCLLAQKTC